jgi:hypothetical protein
MVLVLREIHEMWLFENNLGMRSRSNWEDPEEKWLMRSLRICTPHMILVGLLNRGC